MIDAICIFCKKAEPLQRKSNKSMMRLDKTAKFYHSIILDILGLIFILSSVFKLIGIRTFAETVNMFCAFLGYEMLYGHGLPLAIVICSVELLLGVAAFVPKMREYVQWIYLIVIGYFTYITYLNLVCLYGQIESCGCFGEVIHLTPAESFYKNVVNMTISIIACGVYVYERNLRNNKVAE